MTALACFADGIYPALIGMYNQEGWCVDAREGFPGGQLTGVFVEKKGLKPGLVSGGISACEDQGLIYLCHDLLPVCNGAIATLPMRRFPKFPGL